MKIEISIKPFSTPNFVIPMINPAKKQAGFIPNQGIPLSDISEETLSELCDQFRHDVFMKAGKLDPKESPNAND